MSKKKIVLILAVFVLGSFGIRFFFTRKEPLQKYDGYLKIPVSFFPLLYKPLVKIEIEGEKYTVMLDTGSSHPLDLHERILKQIQSKKFIRTTNYRDLQGTKYPVSQFQIPEISFPPFLKFHNLSAYEESIDFHIKGSNAGRPRSLLGKIKNQLGLFLVDGRIGSSLFESVCCLFELNNRALFIAENLESLQKGEIFKPEAFIKVPLEFSQCGPVLSFKTDLGVKKFLLDTGASHSVYRAFDLSSEDKISLNLIIDNYQLEPRFFLPFPLASDLEFDGILGIDFFKNHAICIDFQGKNLYIQKAKAQQKASEAFYPRMGEGNE